MSKALAHRLLDHPIAANLLMALIICLGIYATGLLNVQMFPTLDRHEIAVEIDWPGADSSTISDAILVPVEDRLRNLVGLKKITSNARLGHASLLLKMLENASFEQSIEDTKQALMQVKNLPPESTTPRVAQVRYRDQVAQIILTRHPQGLEPDIVRHELYQIAHQAKQTLLDQGIATIKTYGLPMLDYLITVPNSQLHRFNTTLRSIGNIIAQSSFNQPIGSIGGKDQQRSLKVEHQRRSLDAFAHIPLFTDHQGSHIKLGDIAHLQVVPREDQVKAFHKGDPALVLHVYRGKNDHTIEVAQTLHKWLANIQQSLPNDINVKLYNEAWLLLKDRIGLLLNNAWQGMLLIFIILFVFLDARVAFWVGVGIPISFCMALFILQLLGGSINMISLFALIMTLGIIVDDAIVVGEAAVAHWEAGQAPLAAVKNAIDQMYSPVWAASLTTLCVFLPLLTIHGLTGRIVRDIPKVALCTLLASLFECFLILPSHLYHSFVHKQKRADKGIAKWRQRFERGFQTVRDRWFRAIVISALQHRFMVVLATVGLLCVSLSLVLLGYIKFNFFPEPEGNIVQADVRFHAGTPEPQRLAFMQAVRNAMLTADHQLSATSNLGSLVDNEVTYINQEGIAISRLGKQYAALEVSLISPELRRATNEMFIQHWRAAIPDSPLVDRLSVVQMRNGTPGHDIELALTSGSSLVAMKDISRAIQRELAKIPGVINIDDDLPYGKQQLILHLLPQARALGLTLAQVAQQLRDVYQGVLVQTFYRGFDEIEVRLQTPRRERQHLRTLGNVLIKTPKGKMLPLQQLAHFKTQRGFDVINHVGGKPTVHVLADVDAKVNHTADVLHVLKYTILPKVLAGSGVHAKFSGRTEEEAETLQAMLHGLWLALALIYIILAWVFRSYLWPLAIMLAIPFGITGAILGHWLMGIDITILSLFGFFGLSGIIVNNSIILINQYLAVKYDRVVHNTAIIEACCQRFRSVILTSITTIAGLAPLMFERSLQAQFLVPVAVSICFGLLYGTVLIFLVIPCMLSFLQQK